MQKLCYKNLLIVLALVFTITCVNAVPQIIVSEVNMSIVSNQTGNSTLGIYHMIGEGGELTQNFNVNGVCNFSWQLDKIPLRFSREVIQNETDMATLIHSLTIVNNVTNDLIECNRNLSICMNDVGYKGNFTQCDTQLDICHANENKLSTDALDYKNQAERNKTWAIIGCIFGIAGCAMAWNFRKKAMVKTIKSPMDSLPRGVKL